MGVGVDVGVGVGPGWFLGLYPTFFGEPPFTWIAPPRRTRRSSTLIVFFAFGFAMGRPPFVFQLSAGTRLDRG